MPIILGGSVAQSIIFTIEKAVLIAVGAQPANQANNIAIYQCDANPALQIGGKVTIAGCTTSAFNQGPVSIAAVGTFIVPNNTADTNGGFSLWTGFSVVTNNAAIAIEIEPTVPTDGAEGSPLGTATGTVTQ